MSIQIKGDRLVISAGQETPSEFVRQFNLWSDRIPKEWGEYRARLKNGHVQIGRRTGVLITKYGLRSNFNWNWYGFYGEKSFQRPRVTRI